MTMIKSLLLAGLAIILSQTNYAQGVNGYAAVSSISGNTINITTVNELDDTFEDGEFIIIMQMQDNVIGNTSNTASFGVLGAIQSAGLYEVRQILSHTESAGIPTSITLSSGLSNTYNINNNASVQVITFPRFGSPNYTTVADMSPPAWNGSIGGVLAFEVTGALTLAHNISADGDGFRGGASDITSSNGGCENTIFISANTTRALKGEGIYKNNNTSFDAAKAKMLTGGGGGNSHNGGGGGGGNFTAGGEGGIGWGCQNNPGLSAGGQGGISLSSNISSSRLFLGGGGGAGERNNNHVTSGGNGGGLIFIKANELLTAGTCGGLSITANGISTPDIGNDGVGGGGAGGSILLDIPTYNVASGCSVDIESNGGNGGSSLSTGIHAGGGGGGQGVVIFTIPEPTNNITTTTSAGTGGCGNTTVPCNSVAATGAGNVDDGVVVASIPGPLPVTLASFDAEKLGDEEVRLTWITHSEFNNDYFTIERSVDGEEWFMLDKVLGNGTSNLTIKYETYDRAPQYGVNYYRLSQIDFDGTLTDHGTRSVFIENQTNGFIVFPNPSQGQVFIRSETGDAVKTVMVQNAMGQLLEAKPYWMNGTTEVDMNGFSRGVYLLHITSQKGRVQTVKVVLR